MIFNIKYRLPIALRSAPPPPVENSGWAPYHVLCILLMNEGKGLKQESYVSDEVIRQSFRCASRAAATVNSALRLEIEHYESTQLSIMSQHNWVLWVNTIGHYESTQLSIMSQHYSSWRWWGFCEALMRADTPMITPGVAGLFFVFCGAAAQRGPWPPYFWGFLITHNDAPQSVGLLWTRHQLVTETSTWQHITLTTDKHPCPWWDSNPLSQQACGRRPTP